MEPGSCLGRRQGPCPVRVAGGLQGLMEARLCLFSLYFRVFSEFLEIVSSQHYKTKRPGIRLLAMATLGQITPSGGSQSRGCGGLGGHYNPVWWQLANNFQLWQVPGRHPRHCSGRTMAYSVNKDSETNEMRLDLASAKTPGRWLRDRQVQQEPHSETDLLVTWVSWSEILSVLQH